MILDVCRFQVKKKQFFKNFSTILSFGDVGTLISFCLISAGKIFRLLCFSFYPIIWSKIHKVGYASVMLVGLSLPDQNLG